jgi:hypothetical protein
MTDDDTYVMVVSKRQLDPKGREKALKEALAQARRAS